MSAGCPPGVQTCTEASGDYSPAYLLSCSSLGFWVQVKSWVRERIKSHQNMMVTGLKQLSRLFCEILYAACHFLDVSLVGE